MYRYNAAYKEINDVSLERMKMAVEYIDRYDIIIIGASCEISVADFPWRAEETL